MLNNFDNFNYLDNPDKSNMVNKPDRTDHFVDPNTLTFSYIPRGNKDHNTCQYLKGRFILFTT